MRTWVLAGMLTAAPTLALCDRVDGAWCGPDGRQITILGDRVVSFGGTETDGIYSRHRYAFTVPEGEAGAGAAVVLNQLSEEEARLSVDGGDGQPWTRCRPVTS